MILLVTHQADVSADLVVRQLQRRGARLARLNTDRLLLDAWLGVTEPAQGASLQDEAGDTFDLSAVRAIWYRNPRPPSTDEAVDAYTRFAQRESWALALGTLLGLDAYWMSEPSAIWRANQKPYQLARARRAGFLVPRTCITRSQDDAWAFIRSASGSVVAKPVTYGNIEGTEPELAIYTTRLPSDLTRADLEPLGDAPVIFQEEITKRRDVRVTVIGRQVFAVAIESQERAETTTDWRRPVVGSRLRHSPIALPADLTERLRSFVADLGLEFGAIDLVESSSGDFYFLEINPNGQWGWLQVETGIDLADAIAGCLQQHDLG
jgi:glutathione synthase/RimK-type ligase-like ATP-grasp enzyme